MITNQSPAAVTSEQAHAVVLGWHKRAFFGRLAEYGIVPENEKEALALLDLGEDLASAELTVPGEKSASTSFDYGDGVYAQAKKAFDNLVQSQTRTAPGFEKESSSHFAGVPSEPAFEPGLIEATYQTAYELSLDPRNYSAAVVKRADNEQALAALTKQAGAEEETEESSAQPNEQN